MNTREQESTDEIQRALIAARIPDNEETMATIADQLREQGKAEGRTEARIETARAMLARGMDMETVLEITGLDRESLEGAPEAG